MDFLRPAFQCQSRSSEPTRTDRRPMPIGIPIPILYLRELLRSELTYLLTYDFLLTFHSNHGLLTSHCQSQCDDVCIP